MIGLDTNVVLRILTLDDAEQVAKARALLATCSPEFPGYVSHLVLIEMVWVLSSGYGYDRTEIADGLQGLLDTIGLRIEQQESVLKALNSFRLSRAVDFEDCLIAEGCAAAGCDYTATFDRGAAKHAGMRLL